MSGLYNVFKFFICQIFRVNLGLNYRGLDLYNVRNSCILFHLISLGLNEHVFWHVDQFLRFVLTELSSCWPVSDCLLTLEIGLIFLKMRVLGLNPLDFKLNRCKVEIAFAFLRHLVRAITRRL